MRVLIVIPARGGSTRVPRKNLAVLSKGKGRSYWGGGDTLLSRACYIAQAMCCEWYVTTDDAEIAQYVTYNFGIAQLCVRRDRECGNVPVVRAVRACYEQAFRLDGKPAETIVLLQPTSPLRTLDDVQGCVSLLERHPEARSVVSVDASTGARNGAVYVVRDEMLLSSKLFDDDSLKYPMPHERSLDINTPEDIEEARRILGP